MGLRGPKPMPTAMKKKLGARERADRRIPGKEPTPRNGVPAMPHSLKHNSTAAKCWNALVPRLTGMRVLTQADGLALEGLCVAYARALEADKDVNKHGLVTKAWDGRLSANPAVSMSRAAWAEVRKFAQEFGLTPAARTRVREHEDSDDDGAARNSDGLSNEDFLFKRSGTSGKVAGSIRPA